MSEDAGKIMSDAVADSVGRSQALDRDFTLDASDRKYLSADSGLTRTILADPELKDLRPMFSHMNSTSFCTEKEASIYKLTIKGIFARKEALADDMSFTEAQSNKYESLELFLSLGMNNNVKGQRFKGLVSPERTQRVAIESSSPAKKRRFGWF